MKARESPVKWKKLTSESRAAGVLHGWGWEKGAGRKEEALAG